MLVDIVSFVLFVDFSDFDSFSRSLFSGQCTVCRGLAFVGRSRSGAACVLGGHGGKMEELRPRGRWKWRTAFSMVSFSLVVYALRIQEYCPAILGGILNCKPSQAEWRA